MKTNPTKESIIADLISLVTSLDVMTKAALFATAMFLIVIRVPTFILMISCWIYVGGLWVIRLASRQKS